MRKFKLVVIGLLLTIPGLVGAGVKDLPGSTNWYFFVDVEQMRSEGPGKALYAWLREEVLDEIRDDSGVDLDRELDQLTAYSTPDEGGVLIIEGKISQMSKDRIMAFIATGGDISPLKSSGKTYYHFGGDEDIDDDVSYDAGNIRFDIDSLGEQSWISTGVKNKVIITSTERQMQELLKNNGKVSGRPSRGGELLVLTAKKAIVQAGMKASAIGDDDWDSNILRNTEQAALSIVVAKDKFALKAKLTTTEPEMAESLASVARGLISLVAFDNDLDDEFVTVLRGTRIEAKGNSLTISVAIDPAVAVAVLSGD